MHNKIADAWSCCNVYIIPQDVGFPCCSNACSHAACLLFANMSSLTDLVKRKKTQERLDPRTFVDLNLVCKRLLYDASVGDSCDLTVCIFLRILQRQVHDASRVWVLHCVISL